MKNRSLFVSAFLVAMLSAVPPIVAEETDEPAPKITFSGKAEVEVRPLQHKAPEESSFGALLSTGVFGLEAALTDHVKVVLKLQAGSESDLSKWSKEAPTLNLSVKDLYGSYEVVGAHDLMLPVVTSLTFTSGWMEKAAKKHNGLTDYGIEKFGASIGKGLTFGFDVGLADMATVRLATNLDFVGSENDMTFEFTPPGQTTEAEALFVGVKPSTFQKEVLSPTFYAGLDLAEKEFGTMKLDAEAFFVRAKGHAFGANAKASFDLTPTTVVNAGLGTLFTVGFSERDVLLPTGATIKLTRSGKFQGSLSTSVESKFMGEDLTLKGAAAVAFALGGTTNMTDLKKAPPSKNVLTTAFDVAATYKKATLFAAAKLGGFELGAKDENKKKSSDPDPFPFAFKVGVKLAPSEKVEFSTGYFSDPKEDAVYLKTKFSF